jgi:starch phosphorylase
MLNGSVQSGKKYKVSYVVDEQGLDDAVGLEIVTLRVDDEGKQHVYSVEPLDVVKREGNFFTFEGTHCIPTSGSFKVACRMYPKNADLPHRQDFCYVKWFN